ncbi:hypothetical protein [Nostoc sp.]
MVSLLSKSEAIALLDITTTAKLPESPNISKQVVLRLSQSLDN